MLYMCGLLLSEAKSVKKLRVEIVARSYLDLGDDCPFWKHTGRPGVAEALDFKPFWKRPSAESVLFFLKPLEILSNVGDCEITWENDSEESITPDVQKVLKRYEKAITGKEPFGREETKWLREEYHVILNRQEQTRRERVQGGHGPHTTWLLDAHKTLKCTHRGHGKRFYRSDHKKLECRGCEKKVAWLVDCQNCSLRACVRCTNELKEKRSDLQDIVRWEEWRRTY
ncbi:MAG: hypothetical protein Q9226_008753 [Calogaya cf. arnoldii]